MKHVSYSQFNTFKTCPYQWKLIYIDKHKIPSASIHLIFGSALHKVLQEYLEMFYKHTAKKADEMDLDDLLVSYMIEEVETYRKHGLENVTNSEELTSYFLDGVKILEWFKKHRGDYFSKLGYELLGCEIQLNVELNNGANFTGKIDIAIKDKKLNTIKIIDFKKSYRGWNKDAKDDPTKRGQLQLYKQFWSEKFNVPIENIEIEFLILKQKIFEQSEYAAAKKRVQRFSPPSGKATLKKIKSEFMTFAETVIKHGDYNLDIEYIPSPSKYNCNYCPFKTRKDLCSHGI